MRDMSPAAVHKRLVFPQNSVLDIPIDMKRKHVPMPPAPIVRLSPPRPPAIPIPALPAPILPYIVARQYPSPEDITRVICEQFRVMPLDLASQRRDAKSSRARQVWGYLARELTPWTLPAIARMLGGRDHTTILHGIRRVESLREADIEFGAKVKAARSAVMSLFNERQNNACFDPREI